MKADALHRKVLDAIAEQRMLSPGDGVLVGVSGGADSMALLSALLTLRESLGLREVRALHVNHGLRGAEAARDEAFVREWCRQQGVALTVMHRNVAALAAERGDGVEEAGRAVRYACFEEARGGDPTVKIATAHTRSDQAETVLMNLLRGSGTRGIAGIAARRGAVIRPLITCSREEIESYCMARAIPYVTDSTNADPAYRRNYLRGTVLPMLKDVNPRLEEALSRTALCAAQDEAYLQELAQKAEAEAQAELDTYDAARLRTLPDALLCRVLQRASVRYGADAEATHIDTLVGWVKNGESGTLMLPGGVCAACTSHRCGFVTVGQRPTEQLLVSGKTYVWGGRSYRLCHPDDVFLERIKKVHRKLVFYALDYDKIIGDLTVSARRAGDRLCLEGRRREKELKALHSEAHVLPALRESLPVLRDREGIVLAVGAGCADRVACDENTQNRVIFAVCKER